MQSIIFVLNNFLVGGVENFLCSLINNIDKKEFKIQIITILGQGPLRQRMANTGAEIIILGSQQYPKNAFLKSIWLMVSFFKLTAFLIKNKPDIVVTSLWQSDILGIFSAKLAGVKKRILIQHDLQPLNQIIKIVKKGLAISLATNIVAISGAVKEFLHNYFSADLKKIVTVNNGINVNVFDNGTDEYKEIVFGSIARLDPVKGHIYIIEALKILKENGISPKTIFYDDGVLRKQLEAKAMEYGLSNIQFAGEEIDTNKMLNSITVLLAPSISEGFGLSILEALMAKKIVISSDLEAVREMINHNQNGILIPPKNALELSRAMRRIIEDREYRMAIKKGLAIWLGQEGKRFDIKNIALEYEKIFKS